MAEREEVLEVVNTYFSIPVTSFTAIRMEQVWLKQDVSLVIFVLHQINLSSDEASSSDSDSSDDSSEVSAGDLVNNISIISISDWVDFVLPPNAYILS